MVSKDNVNYYRFKLEELLKEAEENDIDIRFHIMEIVIQNKKTKEKVSVRDKRSQEHKYIR